jgi:hypothetical protein
VTTTLATAGEVVRVDCDVPWVARVLERAAAGESRPARDGDRPTVHVLVERSRRPFEIAGCDVVTRGAWRVGGGVVLTDACGSGFSVAYEPAGETLVVRARWLPPAATRAAAHVLRDRARLLAQAALLHYPVLWWAGTHGRAPVHVSALDLGGPAPLLAGPSGVGKSTLVDAELAAGHRAACDNLAVTDGSVVWGLVEPRRTADGVGPRTTHGRRESPLPARVPAVHPDCVFAVGLSGSAERPRLRPLDPDAACRALVAGTYMAGELRRYWPFAATMSAATGLGPAAPPVEVVARRLTTDVPCFALTLSRRAPARLSELLPVR